MIQRPVPLTQGPGEIVSDTTLLFDGFVPHAPFLTDSKSVRKNLPIPLQKNRPSPSQTSPNSIQKNYLKSNPSNG